MWNKSLNIVLAVFCLTMIVGCYDQTLQVSRLSVPSPLWQHDARTAGWGRLTLWYYVFSDDVEAHVWSEQRKQGFIEHGHVTENQILDARNPSDPGYWELNTTFHGVNEKYTSTLNTNEIYVVPG
jgi:hypothetical protein